MNKSIKYFRYFRKSTEDDNRQVQSIPDQMRDIEALCATKGIPENQILDTYSESRSAKAPGRVEFNKMLDRIERGEANGIICYQADRLSRNPVDSGRLQWLLVQGKIQHILTIGREYRPEDNQIVFSVDSAQSSEFIKDLRTKVKRGIETKLNKGQAPIMAPVGYLNTKFQERGINYIIPDPERFDLMRKGWDLLLSGKHTVADILNIMNNEWGFTTRQLRTRGGKPISRSALYRIFSDPFYCGMFMYRGKIQNGVHTPMVTVDEFDKAQILLGKSGKPRPKVHSFSFSGCITCDECGSAVVAIEKQKLIKSTGELKKYILYRCSHRKGSDNGKDNGCSQKKYVNVDILEKQITDEIQKYTIHTDFCEWALDILRSDHKSESRQNQAINESLSRSLVQAQKELDNLTGMRIRDLIDDDKFVTEKERISESIAKLKTQLSQTELRSSNTNKYAENVFDFAQNAYKKFTAGSQDDKKTILLNFGGNWRMRDEKLLCDKHIYLEPLQKYSYTLDQLKNRLEPEFSLTNKSFRDNLEIYPVVRSERDLNPRPSA